MRSEISGPAIGRLWPRPPGHVHKCAGSNAGIQSILALLNARWELDRRLRYRRLGTYLLLFAIGAALDGQIDGKSLVVDLTEDMGCY